MKCGEIPGPEEEAGIGHGAFLTNPHRGSVKGTRWAGGLVYSPLPTTHTHTHTVSMHRQNHSGLFVDESGGS